MTIEKNSLLTLLLYCIKQIDSMLTCVCSGIDYKRRQNVVRTSVHDSLALQLMCHVFVLTVIFCSLLNRGTAKWYPFVKILYFAVHYQAVSMGTSLGKIIFDWSDLTWTKKKSNWLLLYYHYHIIKHYLHTILMHQVIGSRKRVYWQWTFRSKTQSWNEESQY